MISPTTETRYALYFVPDAETELYRFGASVLGYDCYTGGEVALPSGAGADWPDKVAEPRRYGFHATLKAPFRLAAGTSPAELQVALDAFVRSRPAVEVGPLQVAEIGSFIALVPTEACRPLDDLAAGCVRQFDRFRAPLTDKEMRRRLTTPLSARQRSQPRSLGLSVRVRRLPVPHDPDRSACRCGARGGFAMAAGGVRRAAGRAAAHGRSCGHCAADRGGRPSRSLMAPRWRLRARSSNNSVHGCPVYRRVADA